MSSRSDVPASPREWPCSPREWIDALVALDTTSRDSNRPVLEPMAGALTAAGATCRILPAPEGDKANLIATFPAADGTVDGGVLVAGHADTVPVDGQDWDSDPFTVTERDGKLFGRGTADMKSFLAIFCALTPRLAGRELSRPLHVAATYDEEVSCDGARVLVNQLDELGIHPEIVLVGEPTSMRAISGHKSMNVLTAHFRGIAAHSSLSPHGLNSIRYAARFVDWYHRVIIDDFRTGGPRDTAYPVPFSTGGVNTARGGIASNTVPAETDLELEFRTIAAVDPLPIIERLEKFLAEEIEPAMRAEHEAARAWLHRVALTPGLDSDSASPAARLAVQLGAEACDDKVTYGTEAGIYAAAGMSAVIVGPGDIAQAHAANEFIALDQVERCERFFANLIEHVTA